MRGSVKRILPVVIIVALAMTLPMNAFSGKRPSVSNSIYLTPLGPVKFKQKGKKVTGKLLKSSGLCPFLKGDDVFKGVMMDANLTGKLRLCRTGGNACEGSIWAFTVAVFNKKDKKISGSSFARGGSCEVPGLIAGKGVVFLHHKTIKPRRRIAKRSKTKKAVKPKGNIGKPGKAAPPEERLGESDLVGPLPEPGAYNPMMASKKLTLNEKNNVKETLYEGGAYLMKGRFIEARKIFKKALKTDPDNAVAYNGIGVTYRMLNDYTNALKYYRKAVSADSTYPDPYYNIACVYSLLKKKQLALKYLKISVMQGFQEPNVADQDPDLNFLHGDSEYENIIHKRFDTE